MVAAVTAPGAVRSQSIERCVEARVGGDVAYGCLNDAFSRLADRAHFPRDTNTLAAESPAPAVGTFNQTATSERMGNAFGVSVVSQRPAAPQYQNPLLTGAGGARRAALPPSALPGPYRPPAPLFTSAWLQSRATGR